MLKFQNLICSQYDGTIKFPVFIRSFRCRMHDLNEALDDLRAVIPYAHGGSVRKLSKIATLLLAKNHIIMQVMQTNKIKLDFDS
ncbi:hypothetical protein CRE_15804 [Caenorhabditis remanei]|uniref:BHLH domain-containing protein n=1 Tax=Caenorhabditis remanei TaxID=31234 RepID=E3NNB7_CAERE|nr:hypothetical protein CRE_15804 [Caenorhabditis remanei]